MTQKLDPRLLELIENAAQDARDLETTLVILLGLDTNLDPDTRHDLEARGLSVRSVIGDVLTGTVRLQDVPQLAASPRVRSIELSSALYPEAQRDIEPFYGE